MHKILTTVVMMAFTLLSTQKTSAQVGIGTTTPNIDAELDITSTNRGVLLPRVLLTNTTSPLPLSADVAGMIVYNTATAGDVTPGFYYNDGTIWIRLGNQDWALLGNAGTNPATNFIGTTDAQDFVSRSNNIERLRLGTTEAVFNDVSNDYDFRIESNTNTRMFAVDAGDDQVRINDGAGYFAGSNHFMSSTDDADHAIVGYTTGAGYGVYAQSTGTATGAIVSITTAASTSVPVYALPQNIAVGVYSDASSNAGSEDAVVGIADNNEGYGGGWFVNSNSGGDGSGYGSAEQGYGVLGMNNTTNDYSVGAFGSVDDSGRRCSGVYGTNSDGTTSLASGALGYRPSAGGTYYGGYFWDNNLLDDHTDGGGRHAETPEVRVNVGFGAIGGLMGGWAKGDIYGMTTKGERYSLYVNGREFTNDVITQLSSTNNSRKRTATYVPTSTTVDITSKGTGNLSNGSGRIVFDKHFSAIASSKEPIIVTVTPLGQTNGVYLASVDKNGFTIKENNNGNSSAQFTWIAMATKAGYETMSNPKELLATDYDEKLDDFMINENLANETDGRTHEMWWDGKEIKYSDTPAIHTYSKNKQKAKVYKPRKKLNTKEEVSYPKEDTVK